ncbi:MAG TPA: RHS repeat domain-containing protein [Gemmataceae bacterium]|nr:RHS repeat domain-containing protein [Gemmataceae bacterium]
MTLSGVGDVTVTDATDRTTFLAYGLNGRFEQVRDGDGRIVDMTNCSCGHVTQIVGPGGEKYTYSYDASGNLTGIRDLLRQDTTFTYDPLLQPADLRDKGGTKGQSSDPLGSS